MLAVVVCDAIAHVKILLLRNKNDYYSELDKALAEITSENSVDLTNKVVTIMRSDNEPLCRGAGYRDIVQKYRISIRHTIPDSPENNPVERITRTLGSTLRTISMLSPPSLWCYAAEQLETIWNKVIVRKYDRAPEYSGYCPEQARLIWLKTQRRDMSSLISRENLRVFGCLVFVRLEKERADGKLGARWVKGVHLGFAKESRGFRIGVMRPCGSKWYLAVAEVKPNHAKFMEKAIVDHLEKLMPDRKEYNEICPADVAPEMLSESCPTDTSGPGREGGQIYFEKRSFSPGDESKPMDLADSWFEGGSSAAPEVPSVRVPNLDEFKSEKERGGYVTRELADGASYGIKRGRGRPRGSRDSCQRSRSLTKKENADSSTNLDSNSEGLVEPFLSIPELDPYEFEEGQEIEHVTVFLSVAEALRGPERVHWVAAIEKERAALFAKGAWREATEEELNSKAQVLPTALRLSRKRDKSHKCRCIILGHLWRNSGDMEVYSPVVSAPGNRAMLVALASEGAHVVFFDLDVAFLNASVSEKLLIRLPPA